MDTTTAATAEQILTVGVDAALWLETGFLDGRAEASDLVDTLASVPEAPSDTVNEVVVDEFGSASSSLSPFSETSSSSSLVTSSSSSSSS